MTDNNDPDQLPQEVSKSERKRRVTALQKMGEALVNLSHAELALIPMEPRLREAIEFARELTSHEAKRRQLQYIGKLMRHVDAEPIEAALNKLQNKTQENKAQFQKLERWREQLIAEGDTVLAKLLAQYPEIDSQHIRQLIRRSQQKKPGAETELFRYLREIIER